MPSFTNRGIVALAPSEDAATTAWVNAVVGAGGSVTSGRRTLVNNLITYLKNNNGVWTALDRLWIWAAENPESALVDLKANELATLENAPTFTTDRGYTGAVGGGGKAIHTAFIPGTTAGNYARDSSCLGIWTRTAADGTTGALSGMTDGGTSITTSISNNAFGVGTIEGEINSAFGGAATLNSTGDGTGLVVANRSGASALELYRNGSSVDTDTKASVALTNAVAIWFLARNNSGSINQPSSEQQIVGLIGGSMGSSAHGSLYTGLLTHLQAIGAQ